MYVKLSDGQHELPTMTLAVADAMEAAQQAPRGRERWEAELGFLVSVLGDEAVEGECGDARVDRCDLIALDALFEDVCAAYEAPANAAVERRISGQLAALKGLDLDKLASTMDAMERMSRGRQGFKRVR